MQVKKANLPNDSTLSLNTTHYHYIDSYEGEFYDKENTISSTEVGKAFFMNTPKWIQRLFTLRNKIVSIIGLKTPDKISNRQKLLNDFKCEPGEQLGLFKVYEKTAQEVVLGEDDKHLDFRVSLYVNSNTNKSQTKKLIISTTVTFNNWLGRLYFLPVKPFHQLIVPTMLKGILKNIEKQIN